MGDDKEQSQPHSQRTGVFLALKLSAVLVLAALVAILVSERWATESRDGRVEIKHLGLHRIVASAW
jgi:hypothetical protein